MRILLVDHYDSYTHLLAYTIAEVTGVQPVIVEHDKISPQDLADSNFTHLILSPGPGHPAVASDFSLGIELKKIAATKPILGICLGMQGLAYTYGAKIGHAKVPMHGVVSGISNYGHPIFKGVSSLFAGVRYHSLVVEKENLPNHIHVLATAIDDGAVMAIQIGNAPIYGLQFHPEAYDTKEGKTILANFFHETQRGIHESPINPQSANSFETVNVIQTPINQNTKKQFHLTISEKKSDISRDNLISIFETKYAPESLAFWVDGAYKGEPFTLLGTGQLAVKQEAECFYDCTISKDGASVKQIKLDTPTDILDILQQKMPTIQCDKEVEFPFSGGWIGYLGYESLGQQAANKKAFALEMPDAIWIFADHFSVYMHDTKMLYDCCLSSYAIDINHSISTSEISSNTTKNFNGISKFSEKSNTALQEYFDWNLNRKDYLVAIKKVKEQLISGDSYEVCLSNFYSIQFPHQPWHLFTAIESGALGKYSVYFQSPWGNIVSHSPELFLSIHQKQVITEPIKGTLQTHLYMTEKEKSELRMITDLLRNDLAKTAITGSIRVLQNEEVMEWGNLWQQYSQISSKISDRHSIYDAIRCAFPGGSITGAPKKRTCEIIEQLEKYRRGPYTGAIGFIDANQNVQLNIAIRTVFTDGKKIQGGVGGGIIHSSNPLQEWEEIQQKAAPTLRAILNVMTSGFLS